MKTTSMIIAAVSAVLTILAVGYGYKSYRSGRTIGKLRLSPRLANRWKIYSVVLFPIDTLQNLRFDHVNATCRPAMQQLVRSRRRATF